MALLELRGIHKSFGGIQALRDVSVTIELGRVHAIVGENGAGKSTLIKLMMGVLTPDAGEIRLDGQPVVLQNPAHAKALGFAAVYQEPLIYPHLTVLENIFIARPMRKRWGGLDRNAMVERIGPIFERLDLSLDLLFKPMRELRLGYQQMVLIAQALVYDSRLILFDEPTSILSGTETDHLFEIIRYLRRAGKAVVYISHRLEELLAVADEATVLTDGRMVGHVDREGLNPDDLLTMMMGKAMREYRKAPLTVEAGHSGDRPPLLSVTGWSKPGMFEDVNFQLWPGEVLGFYGQVGAGRSEVAQSLFGYFKPDRGEATLNGKRLMPKNPAAAIRAGLGYVPEDRKLQGIFGSQSITNNMISVVLPKLVGRLARVRPLAVTEMVERYTKALNIKIGALSDTILSLSGGGQQKVVLSRWMAEDLKVLILDEPTRGIDVPTKRDLHELIRELAARGLGVIVISSDLPEVMAVSSRLIVMNRGRVVASYDAVRDSLAEDVLRAAIGLDRRQGEDVL